MGHAFDKRRVHRMKAASQKLMKECEEGAGHKAFDGLGLNDQGRARKAVFDSKGVACRIKPGQKSFIVPGQRGFRMIKDRDLAGQRHSRPKAHGKLDLDRLSPLRLAFETFSLRPLTIAVRS